MYRIYILVSVIIFSHSIVYANGLNTVFNTNIESSQKLVFKYAYTPFVNKKSSLGPYIFPPDTLMLVLNTERGETLKYTIRLQSYDDRISNYPQPAFFHSLYWYPSQIGTITAVSLETNHEAYFTSDVLQFSILMTSDTREYAQDYVITTASLEDILQWDTQDQYSYHPEFSLFRWQSYPDVLIFSFSSRKAQAKYLKRLAFFAEKTHTRGTVVPLSDIENRIGWGAHDYRAEDLVAFFNEVHQSQRRAHPILLTQEEELLRSILLEIGMMNIITSENTSTDDKYNMDPTSSYSSIVSYARSDRPSLQRTLLFHELLHTIYFRDVLLRTYVSEIWDTLPSLSQAVMKGFLRNNGYDSDFDYLVKNEYFAYLLQRAIDTLDWYIDVRIFPESKIHMSKKELSSFKRTLHTHAMLLSQYMNVRYRIYDGDIRYVIQE